MLFLLIDLLFVKVKTIWMKKVDPVVSSKSAWNEIKTLKNGH